MLLRSVELTAGIFLYNTKELSLLAIVATCRTTKRELHEEEEEGKGREGKTTTMAMMDETYISLSVYSTMLCAGCVYPI